MNLGGVSTENCLLGNEFLFWLIEFCREIFAEIIDFEMTTAKMG